MGTYFITGEGKDVFLKRLIEDNTRVDSVEGIMVNVPENVVLDSQKCAEILNAIPADKDVQITKLNI